MHSLGGGTGSGLGTLLLEKLSEEYSDKLCINFSVFPGSTNGGTSDVVTEPYNAILSLNALIESSSGVFGVDNSALNRICMNNLKLTKPTFADTNNILAKSMSGATATLRFPGFQNSSELSNVTINLVPFPRLHFLMQSQAPLLGQGQAKFEKLGVTEIAQQMFDSRCLLSDSGDITTQGRILTASCLFRGSNVSAYEAESTIANMRNKKSGSFVEWIPDNMMTSICKVPAPWNKNSDCTGTFLVNSTVQQ